MDWVIGLSKRSKWKIGKPVNRQISESVNGYNIGVADEPKSRVVSAETIGLIVIAVMLAIMILARWAGIIAWSAR